MQKERSYAQQTEFSRNYAVLASSIYYGKQSVSSVSGVDHYASIRSYYTLFSTYFRYSYAGGKFIYTVTCIPIARQRPGKHSPAKRTRATEGRPLLGNGPVNNPP
jgi:hypothetical protein